MSTDAMSTKGIRLRVSTESWPLKNPFRVTGFTLEAADVVLVRAECRGHVGWGEGVPIMYRTETSDEVVNAARAAAAAVEDGASRRELIGLMTPGPARNAVDAALWSLEAAMRDEPVWHIAGLPEPKPLVTAFSLGVDTPAAMAAKAVEFAGARILKIKLDGGEEDAARVGAIREARPDVQLVVDANQGWSREKLEEMRGVVETCGIALVEQPVRVGQDEQLRGISYPCPLAADESMQDLPDLEGLVGLYSVVNIKLDKCGGLTRGLDLLAEARRLGFGAMVGTMGGTSLSLNAHFLMAQGCDLADLDGAYYLRQDREPAMLYEDGVVRPSDSRWSA